VRPDNDDWLESFCSKIAPCYVPNYSEIFPCYSPSVRPDHVLTNNFNISELQLAISSRKSIASGLDNISPLMLKYLPKNALDTLLSIMNDILNNQQIPLSWNSYKIIPIPKQNSNTSFRPIAISSSVQNFRIYAQIKA